jgi:hypothetical protein
MPEDVTTVFELPRELCRQFIKADRALASESLHTLFRGGWLQPTLLCARKLGMDLRFRFDRHRRILFFFDEDWVPVRGRLRLTIDPDPHPPRHDALETVGLVRVLRSPKVGQPRQWDPDEQRNFVQRFFALLDEVVGWELKAVAGSLAGGAWELPAHDPGGRLNGHRLVRLAAISALGVADEMAAAVDDPDARRLRILHPDLAPAYAAQLSIAVRCMLTGDGDLGQGEDDRFEFDFDVDATVKPDALIAGAVVPRFNRVVTDLDLHGRLLRRVRQDAGRFARARWGDFPGNGRGFEHIFTDYLLSTGHNRSARFVRLPDTGAKRHVLVEVSEPLDGAPFRAVFMTTVSRETHEGGGPVAFRDIDLWAAHSAKTGAFRARRESDAIKDLDFFARFVNQWHRAFEG